MDRKDRLKITSTPERRSSHFKMGSSNQNIYQDTRLKVNKDDFDMDNYDVDMDNYNHENDSLFIDNPVNKNKKFGRFLSYLYFVFPYLIILYLLVFSNTNNPEDDNKLEDLVREIDILKKENIKLSNTEHLINICKIEQGSSVIVNTDNIYKYGLLGMRKFNDPNIILGDSAVPGDCLSLKGAENNFILKFSKLRKFDNIYIFHPETDNKKSAIKKFRLRAFNGDQEIDIGIFEYDISKENCQVFKFDKVEAERLVVDILSNHGYKKYTTVYKIYILGV
jgi:hypothetical protein